MREWAPSSRKLPACSVHSCKPTCKDCKAKQEAKAALLPFRISTCPTWDRSKALPRCPTATPTCTHNVKQTVRRLACLQDLHMAHVEQVKGAVNVHDARPRRRALAAAELQRRRRGEVQEGEG
jgi:hypothetical protein